jgi:hypothetical protein
MEDIQEILDKIIPKIGMVTVIRLPRMQTKGVKSISFSHDQSTFIVVPNPQDIRALRTCRELKATGYDWKDVFLKAEQVKYNQMFVFFGDSYHDYSQVEDRLTKSVHIHEIQLTDEELEILFSEPWKGKDTTTVNNLDPETTKEQSDPNFRQNSYVNPRTAYPRCRALWKNHNTKFSEWERKFVQDIGKRLAANQSLSEKQRTALGRIFGKYKVTPTATASEEN